MTGQLIKNANDIGKKATIEELTSLCTPPKLMYVYVASVKARYKNITTNEAKTILHLISSDNYKELKLIVDDINDRLEKIMEINKQEST